MENKKIDFIVYEASMNRMERTNKRQFILNVILIIVLFLSYAGIIIYSMIPVSYDTETNMQEANGSQIEQNIGG